MNSIFVAGTNTGVGKTFITREIARYFRAMGYKVVVQKWVETGVRSSKAIFSFKLPASPHLAARQEGMAIDVVKIKKAFKDAARKNDIVIIEGTGGLFVPLTPKLLLIDLVKELKIPVLLVSANRLGTINHTLLSLEALKRRKMDVLGVILNSVSRRENTLISEDNPKIIEKFAKGIPVWISGYRKT